MASKKYELEDEEDGFELVGLEALDKENHSLLDNNKQIANLLKVLQKPWAEDDLNDLAFDDVIEGYLYKKNSSGALWKRYYFTLVGNQLCYYKKKENNKKPNGILNVSFLSEKSTLRSAELNAIGGSRPVSKEKFDVYCPNRMVTLAAENSQDLDKFIKGITSIIKENLPFENYEKRRKASEDLKPLFEAKSEEDQKRLYDLLAVLQSNGVYAGKKLQSAKASIKGGRLEIEHEENEFDPYYVLIQGHYLYYFKTLKSPPKGALPLKYAEVSVLDADSNRFIVRTKKHSYIFKAKHKAAMDDWIQTIDKVAKNKMTELPSNQEDEGFLDISDDSRRYFIQYRTGKKEARKELAKKVFKFPKGPFSVTIGRFSTCNVIIEDKNISREHCKIESKDGKNFTIVDLGSSSGTKLNGTSITTKENFKLNDIVKLGQTKLRLKSKLKSPSPY